MDHRPVTSSRSEHPPTWRNVAPSSSGAHDDRPAEHHRRAALVTDRPCHKGRMHFRFAPKGTGGGMGIGVIGLLGVKCRGEIG